MRITIALGLASLFAVSVTRAGEPSAAGPGERTSGAAADLERLKGLAGTWTGKAGKAGGQTMDATIVWRVTGGGSAVMETIDPGTPHEMVTLYHLDAGRLVLTHYCAAGNQPTMAQVRSEPGTLAFEFARGTNMKPDDMHMHAARIAFLGPDRVDAEWTSWQGGKAAGTMRFEMKRGR